MVTNRAAPILSISVCRISLCSNICLHIDNSKCSASINGYTWGLKHKIYKAIVKISIAKNVFTRVTCHISNKTSRKVEDGPKGSDLLKSKCMNADWCVQTITVHSASLRNMLSHTNTVRKSPKMVTNFGGITLFAVWTTFSSTPVFISELLSISSWGWGHCRPWTIQSARRSSCASVWFPLGFHQRVSGCT